MLVLSRLIDEKIIIYHITDNKEKVILCTVSVNDIRGNKVRLGFEADKHIIIHREEVFTKIVKENKT